MNDDQLLRYSRQIMLPAFGIEGQQKLLETSVLIVGLGGLGSPVAMYLAAAGVGRLILVDDDQVDLSNLQRQIAHTNDRIGQPKVESAKITLQALNPEIKVETIAERLDTSMLQTIISGIDLVVDCCDNFATRFALNESCCQHRVPLVSGAAIRMEGQISLFSGQPGGPCYQCLYPPDGTEDQRCVENGVLAPVVGIIGAMQATEAIKALTGLGEVLNGRLLLLDANRMSWRELKISADPACPVCGHTAQA